MPAVKAMHTALPITYPAACILATTVASLSAYLEIATGTQGHHALLTMLTACFMLSMPILMLVAAGYTARAMSTKDPPNITHARLLGNTQLGIILAIAVAAGIIAWGPENQAHHRLATIIFITAYTAAIPTTAYGSYHYAPRIFRN